MAQTVKNLPAIQETLVWSLGREDPLDKGMATHSSILSREFHAQMSLVGYSPWGCKESDMTEWLTHMQWKRQALTTEPTGNSTVIFKSLVVVQSLSRVWLFVTPWTAAHQASLSITNSRSLLKLMSIESVMPSNHLVLCHPLLLLPSISPASGSFLKQNPSPTKFLDLPLHTLGSLVSRSRKNWAHSLWSSCSSSFPSQTQRPGLEASQCSQGTDLAFSSHYFNKSIIIVSWKNKHPRPVCMNLWISQAASAPNLLGVTCDREGWGVKTERKGGPFSPLGVASSGFARGTALSQTHVTAHFS